MHMLPLLLPIVLASLQSGVNVDRSAEPKLKSIFEKYGKMRNIRADITKTYRDREDGPFFGDRQLMVWYEGPTTFRVLNSSVWGDGGLYVANGKDMYIDRLDGFQPATLRTFSAKSLRESHADFSGGDATTFFFNLLRGEDGFRSAVSPGGEIKQVGNAVRFQSKDLGVVTLYPDGDLLVTRIEYDNLPMRNASYRMFPFWGEKPLQPLEREEIRYVSMGRRLPKSMFDTKPPKGVSVTDERKKKPPVL